MYTHQVTVVLACITAAMSAGCQMLQNADESAGVTLPGAPISVVTESTSIDLLNQTSLHLPLDAKAVEPRDEAGELLSTVLDKAYPASRFAGMDPDAYNSHLVSLRNGLIEQLVPLALVHRYEFRDFNLSPGAVVDVFRLEEVRLRFPALSPSTRPTGGRVTVAGLIPSPGTRSLGSGGLETVKDLRREINEELDARGRDRQYDVITLTRLVEGRPYQMYIPFYEAVRLTGNPGLAGSTKYDEGMRFFATNVLERTALKDGDVVEFTRLSLMPEIVAGSVRQDVEQAVTQALQSHRARRAARKEKRKTKLSQLPGANRLGQIVHGVRGMVPKIALPTYPSLFK